MRYLIFLFSLFLVSTAHAQAPQRIVALGDSLTAGYGLPAGQDFATKLQEALIKEGLNVTVQNAGLSGDTMQGGRTRLANAIAGDPKPRLVIIALGANDMLRRMDPQGTRENLRAILQTLKDQNIPAFLIGMRNPHAFGPFMTGPYASLYKDLADEFDVPLYAFFLKGVALDKNLNQADGLHPNEKGVAIMVENIAPEIADALK
jgi:acyl-CoA thioesterase I